MSTIREEMSEAVHTAWSQEFMELYWGSKVNRDGTITQKVQLQFKERDESWNKFLRKDKIAWDYIQDFDGNRVFTTTDLSPLIQL